MNNFANSLFTLLFGWARAVIQQLWSFSASSQFGGFLLWLGDHWTVLVLALVLFGTVVDMLVWLFRWQPYLVWKSRMRKIARWFRGEKSAPARRFEKGYQRGIAALDDPEQETPEESGEAAEAGWNEAAWSQPPQSEPNLENAPGILEEILAREADYGGIGRERQGRQFASSEAYEASPPVTASWLSSAYQKTDQPAARRKRRSEKYEKKKPMWTSKLMIPEVEEDSLLNGLPPAVDRQRAFHDPVYPMQNHTGANTGWKPSMSGRPSEEQYKR